MRRRVLGLHRSRRGAYLIPCHKDLLRDVELKELRVHAIHKRGDDVVYGGCDLADNVSVARGEVQEVGEVGDTVLQRRLDEQRVDLLCEYGACVGIVLGVSRCRVEGSLRVFGLGGRLRCRGRLGASPAAREGAHKRVRGLESEGCEVLLHDENGARGSDGLGRKLDAGGSRGDESPAWY